MRCACILALLVAVMVLSVQGQSQPHHHQRTHHHHAHHQQHQQQQQQRKHHQRRQLSPPAHQPSTHPDEQVELVHATTGGRHNATGAAVASTRLRRIYHHGSHSGSHSGGIGNNRRHGGSQSGNGGKPDWGMYNTYNVHTNTYGYGSGGSGGSSLGHGGKGDDNTQDVEFISTTNGGGHQPQPAHPGEWPSVLHKKPRRAYDYVPPPPLVPPTTGAGISTTTTTTTTTTGAPLAGRRNAFVTHAPDSSTTTTAPPPTPTTTVGPVTPTATTARRYYPDHVTEDPFGGVDTSLGGGGAGSGKGSLPPTTSIDAHEMERRHICVQQRTITMPVKTTEVYSRPIWKHIKTPCQLQTHVNQMCTRVQLVHEPAYRDVIRHKSAQQVTTGCCTGWMKETPHSDACMKPVCAARCQNGGTCSGPDTCSCPAGFTGRYCEQDINECKEEKPCDQTCINTIGSYYCKCRDGFMLQPDQQSCKKIDLDEDDAFEARDLENEIEAGDSEVSDRLQRIERSLANERVHTHELQKTLQATYSVVDTLKSRLTTLEKQQQDLHRLQTNLYATESRTYKLEGMVNLLMKCRNAPNAYCP